MKHITTVLSVKSFLNTKVVESAERLWRGKASAGSEFAVMTCKCNTSTEPLSDAKNPNHDTQTYNLIFNLSFNGLSETLRSTMFFFS